MYHGGKYQVLIDAYKELGARNPPRAISSYYACSGSDAVSQRSKGTVALTCRRPATVQRSADCANNGTTSAQAIEEPETSHGGGEREACRNCTSALSLADPKALRG